MLGFFGVVFVCLFAVLCVFVFCVFASFFLLILFPYISVQCVKSCNNTIRLVLKIGTILFNNTFYIRLYGVRHMVTLVIDLFVHLKKDI